MKKLIIFMVAILSVCCFFCACSCNESEPDEQVERYPSTFESEFVLYDYEEYTANFELLRISEFFGKISVNTQADYVKSGKQSMLIQPYGNKGSGKEKPYVIIPTDSERFNFNYSDFFEIKSVKFDMFNAYGEDVKVWVGVTTDAGKESLSNFSQEFTLKAGKWNKVEYVIWDALKYSTVSSVYIRFENYQGNDKEIPKIYMDDFTLNKTDVVKQDLVFTDTETNGELISADQLATLNPTGDVSGNVYKYGPFNANEINKVKINLPLTLEQIRSKVRQGYKNLKLSMCVTSTATDQLNFIAGETTLIASNIYPAYNEWQTYKFTLGKIGSFSYDKEGYFETSTLLSAYLPQECRQVGEQDVQLTFYLSEVTLDEETKIEIPEVQPETAEIMFITDANDAENIENTNELYEFKEFLTYDDWLAENIDIGETDVYFGNAIKAGKSGSRTWTFTHNITEEQYDEYFANGFTELYFWVAAVNSESAVQFATLKDADTGEYCGLQSKPKTFTNGQWQKIVIKLNDDVKAELFDGKPVELFKSYSSDKPSSTATWYFGDIGFQKPLPVVLAENELFFMDKESDKKDITVDTGTITSELLTPAEWAEEGITGDYTGNAFKLSSDAAGSRTWKLNHYLTEAKYDEYVNGGYTNIYIWFTATNPDGEVMFNTVSDNLLTGSYENKVWNKLKVKLSPELKAKLFDGSAVELFKVYCIDLPKSISTIYLGDIGFEITPPAQLAENELFFIDDSKDTNAISVDLGAITSNYLTASQWAEEGITANGYTGNALKLSSSKDGSRTWKLSHELTEQAYDKYVTDGYTKLYIWFTADDPSDNRVFNAQNVPNNLVIGGSYTEKQWQKLTVTLDSTVKAKLFDGSPVELFKVYCTTGTATIYIGDIGFEQ